MPDALFCRPRTHAGAHHVQHGQHRALSLALNPAVQRHVDGILAELARAQASITQAKPATAEHKQTFQQFMERTAGVRGRAPLMPYMGVGLGNGPLVQLADGSVKWDMLNGIGVHMFGHSDARMVRAALEGSLSDLCMQGNLTSNADSVAFAEGCWWQRRAALAAGCSTPLSATAVAW